MENRANDCYWFLVYNVFQRDCSKKELVIVVNSIMLRLICLMTIDLTRGFAENVSA
jgi:hypothetical protein